MRKLFYNQDNFNNDINNWDVSGVIDMSGMFYNCEMFNKPLDKWNIKKSKKYDSRCFYNCKRFNKSLDTWDLGNIDEIRDIFMNCKLDASDVLDTWFRTDREDTYTDCTDIYLRNQSKEYHEFVDVVRKMDLEKNKKLLCRS